MRTTLCLALILAFGSSATSASAGTKYEFSSQRRPGQTDHVVVNIKVGGETKFVDKGNQQREELNAVCDLEYDEKTLDVPDKPDGVWRSLRYYSNASATIRVGDDPLQPTLRPDRRIIGAEAAGQTTSLFSPFGSLSRSELDLLDVQANTLLWDQLLPDKPVAIGDAWPHTAVFMAAMLGLDEVAKTDVESRLKEVTDVVARFEIRGQIEGAIHGVPSKIELQGKYRFDRRSRRIDWVGLLLKEDRQSSLVADGLDVSSVFQMIVRPVGEAAELSDAAAKTPAAELKPSPPLMQLSYESPRDGWRFDHDRRWYVYRDQRDMAVLRMIDRGESLAQCNVSSLQERTPDKLVALDAFQEDVRRALDKNFGEFVEAGQKTDDANHRILRVAVDGKASDIPIRWIYYHLADPQGRQAAFVFTVEKNLLDRFGDADRTLVQSFRFADPAKHGDVAKGKVAQSKGE